MIEQFLQHSRGFTIDVANRRHSIAKMMLLRASGKTSQSQSIGQQLFIALEYYRQQNPVSY
jgi:hypothetical protein